MARRRNPARLVVALSVAAALAIFLVYNALAGGTRQLTPSDLGAAPPETVVLAGMVVGTPAGDARGEGLRFTLTDPQGEGSARVPVVYQGSVPDMFRTGRDISVTGKLVDGTFVAEPDSLVTKCPSKYSPDDGSTS